MQAASDSNDTRCGLADLGAAVGPRDDTRSEDLRLTREIQTMTQVVLEEQDRVQRKAYAQSLQGLLGTLRGRRYRAGIMNGRQSGTPLPTSTARARRSRPRRRAATS